MNFSCVMLEILDGVGVVRMGRPPSNAINPEWMNEFSEILKILEEDASIRSVVITSNLEKIFMAGADISYLQQLHQQIQSSRETLSQVKIENTLQQLFTRLELLPKPSIACINGHALGGGCEIALACHYRFMAQDQGTIGLTEVNLGILPGAGGTQRMIRTLGHAKAIPLLVEGKRLRGEEALNLGLVHGIYPLSTLFDSCMELAKRLALQAPIAVREILRSVYSGRNVDLDRGLEIETHGFLNCIQTQDAMEGFQAFFEKRKPNFQGK
jgi:enoyl-CoA hydratase/carnithine racemase